MKKITFFASFILMSLLAWAQPEGHFASPMALRQATPFSDAKNDYQWKMSNFHTDDYYQICNFSYNADHRLLAMSDSIYGESVCKTFSLDWQPVTRDIPFNEAQRKRLEPLNLQNILKWSEDKLNNR